MTRLFKHCAVIIALITVITTLNYRWVESLGLTGVSMLYLLLVVGVAYFCPTTLTIFVAFVSFLLLNYFFVEPTFTFQIAHVASLASLISFLVVALLITSLVKRLKHETDTSQRAFARAEFLRQLAEKLSHAETMDGMLQDCQQLLQNALGKPVHIITDDMLQQDQYALTTEQTSAIAWVQANGKPLGYGTGNWPDLDCWIVPFNRLSSHDPVVLVREVATLADDSQFDTLKLATEQIALSYQHVLQKQKTLVAEAQAREEAIKGALLASIAHDMRTPLTAILGAATTLNQRELTIDQQGMQHLTTLISSQAKHLARTTENILSLVRLESLSHDAIAMTLQSPEEIVGILANLYQYQSYMSPLSIRVQTPDLLIQANSDLVLLALTNLVENAIQANQAQDLALAPVEIIVEADDEHVCLRVCDSGIGFPDGFNTSNIKKFASTRSKGFGLGLSIVEAVAKLNHASLVFEKNQGQGAMVSLIFNQPKVDLQHVG